MKNRISFNNLFLARLYNNKYVILKEKFNKEIFINRNTYPFIYYDINNKEKYKRNEIEELTSLKIKYKRKK